MVAVESVPSTNGKRLVKVIAIGFDLGGGTIKQKKISSRSVKADEAPGTMAVTTPLVNSLVTDEGQVGEGSEDTTSPSSRNTTPPTVLLEKQTSADFDQFASSSTEEEEEEERVLQARSRPSPPVNEGHVVTMTSGVEWFQASRRNSSFNGNVCFRQWSV